MTRSRSEEAQRVRAYRVSHAGNTGKCAALRAMLPHWQRGLVHVQLLQTRRMQAGEQLGWIETKDLPGYLSQRQWKSVVNQVNGNLRSWQGNAERLVREVIRESDFSNEDRRRLYTLNLRHEWWSDFRLTTIITRLLRSRIPFPNLSRVRTMLMNGPIAQIEEAEDSSFDGWIRFSVLPGNPTVRIPFRSNNYFAQAAGETSRFCQVTVAKAGAITIKLIKKSEPAQPRGTQTAPVIGVSASEAPIEWRDIALDWGLVNLFTTDDGRRMGTRLYAWLKARDAEITALEAALNRQQIPFEASTRWNYLTSRIQGYVTNEVGRVLNRLAADDVRSITVEKLDFRGKSLSKSLRRIVSRAGRAAVALKLRMLTEDLGIKVIEVNAAYTSQTCSGCGYAARANRTTQNLMKCRFCGKTLHADVNAARNLADRRSAAKGHMFTPLQQILASLDRDFTSRWGVDAAGLRERQSRPDSRATSATMAGSR